MASKDPVEKRCGRRTKWSFSPALTGSSTRVDSSEDADRRIGAEMDIAEVNDLLVDLRRVNLTSDSGRSCWEAVATLRIGGIFALIGF